MRLTSRSLAVSTDKRTSRSHLSPAGPTFRDLFGGSDEIDVESFLARFVGTSTFCLKPQINHGGK